jgi:DNA-binding MarR family transcriptional regulator
VSRHDQPDPPIDKGSNEPPAEDIRLQIDLRLRLDEVAEVEAEVLRVGARRQPNQHDLRRLASSMYDARRRRDRMLGHRLFGEPGWDMLLALYCLPRRGVMMTVTALTHSANVPETTGLRWQKTLTEEGLIERGPQGADARKQIIRLTSSGRDLLERYLTRLFHCGTPVRPISHTSSD